MDLGGKVFGQKENLGIFKVVGVNHGVELGYMVVKGAVVGGVEDKELVSVAFTFKKNSFRVYWCP